ncbi:MAG: spondin domain-containing protein [Cyclobacteriaceae bacterium]|nr:spondin domain-containing protein [Cyclobacteriaceae bacterium]
MKKMFCSLLVGLVIVASCKKEEPMVVTSGFRVTIENVFAPKDYFSEGVSDAVGPGSSTSYSFHAGKGHFLSFATMFAQSNDLFYAFPETGISLYDANGNALTGDITNMVNLYDAGTEVNQEPGVGVDQAPRQSASNTGIAEGGTVNLITTIPDGFTYPADDAVIKVSISHDGGTMFTVTLSNVSDLSSFQTPLAPGVWVIHYENQKPLFSIGATASTELEALAEDGINQGIMDQLNLSSGYVSPIAPGVFSISKNENPIFMLSDLASNELESLSEDGNPSGFSTLLDGNVDVVEYGIFNTPSAGSSPAPVFPGEKYEFTFTASVGDKLSFATMLVQTNDLFIGLDKLTLFNGSTPISGDITASLMLYDALTETNEYPGAGNSQAPRQGSANMGTTETGTISIVADNFSYPGISEMVTVTISPM